MDSKRTITRRGASRKNPIVVGTGLIALDVVIADSFQCEPLLCAGGTCGNVLTALAFLEWDAYPIGRLRADAASKRVTEDLKSWGVRLDFVTLGDQGSTPVVVQHIRRNTDGEPFHSFSRKCPTCGTWLPWYKAFKAADVAALTTLLPPADVFYFDRTSRGAVELARHANERGWLVVFEPSSSSDPALLADALEVSHVVKVASDRLDGNRGVLEATEPLLLIETQGARGLRYKHRVPRGNVRWKRIDALSGSSIVDTAGAGDWCTAGIVSRLGVIGVKELRNAASELVEDSLNLGQAMAAWACQFHGARGGMYESSKDEFVQSIKAVLKGTRNATPKRQLKKDRKRSSQHPLWCDYCLIDNGIEAKTVVRK